MLYKSLAKMIGHTPLLEANRFQEAIGTTNKIYTKLELFNPGGSVKDRVALYMLEKAIENKQIDENTLIIEPTSGNTGIGLAAICKSKGLKCMIVMPSSMSEERKKLLKAYGATLVLTSPSEGMQGAIDEANRLASQHKNSFIAGQFENKNNPLAHFETTAKEIDEDMDVPIDYFVAGIGTGGTISGVGRYLKQKYSNVQIIGVEPEDSPLITKQVAGPHGIQGIGANFIPDNLNLDIVDQVRTISTKESYAYSRLFLEREGILVGISSGAALAVASQLAKEVEGKNIVVLLPDGGERYLSTPLFEDIHE